MDIHMVPLMVQYFEGKSSNTYEDALDANEFGDDNSNLMKMAKSSLNRLKCLKRRNCSIRAVSPFPIVFS